MKPQLHRSGLSETMVLTLAVWLCSLVLIGLIVAPLLGLRAAGTAAVGLLVALLVICWGICVYRLPGSGDQL
ncbi:MAG TPA: hypothetical protein DEP84_12900 [Chloroflexi bacterium]|nr:hypothetical protein [Chloroflexota bacterium]